MAETLLLSRAMVVVVKNRRIGSIRANSFSSPPTTDWQMGEKLRWGEAPRTRPVEVISLVGSMADHIFVSPSIETVMINWGWAGYADVISSM
jgi:hypothetical protein